MIGLLNALLSTSRHKQQDCAFSREFKLLPNVGWNPIEAEDIPSEVMDITSP